MALRTWTALAILIAPALALGSCKLPQGSSEGAPDATATPSPQASAMPAPLANTPTSVTSAVVTASPDGNPPPVPLRSDVALPADSLSRETTVYTLSAVIKEGDLSGPLRAPEVNNAGLDAARKKTELRLAIELGASRMHVALLGSGWLLPAETELRARSDRYGHLVVWPGGTTYRPLAPGTLRALIGERRFDVAPVTPAEITLKEDLGKRIGIRTRKVEVTTRAAKATFEIGRAVDLADGGVLVCRLILDLMNAPPSSSLCADGDLPMRAELRWTGRGSMVFEVTGVLKHDKPELPPSTLLVPPAGATFSTAPLPSLGFQPLLSQQDLAAFRTGPVDVPGSRSGEGLVVTNSTDQLRVLYIDGIAAAWAAPGARDLLPGLHRGRYIAQARTFLGEAFEAPVTQVVPGIAQLGTTDAGLR